MLEEGRDVSAVPIEQRQLAHGVVHVSLVHHQRKVKREEMATALASSQSAVNYACLATFGQPMSTVNRLVRLELARQALLQGANCGVAMKRYGFKCRRKFANQFQERYHALPSDIHTAQQLTLVF